MDFSAVHKKAGRHQSDHTFIPERRVITFKRQWDTDCMFSGCGPTVWDILEEESIPGMNTKTSRFVENLACHHYNYLLQLSWRHWGFLTFRTSILSKRIFLEGLSQFMSKTCLHIAAVPAFSISEKADISLHCFGQTALWVTFMEASTHAYEQLGAVGWFSIKMPLKMINNIEL